MMSWRLRIFLTVSQAVLWCAGCADSSPPSSTGIAGVGSIHLARSGTGFRKAENDRVQISEASLQPVAFGGNYYVRWTFAIRPKQQALQLATIRIEDVTGSAPVLLVNDVAPQQDAGIWRENAGLMEISSASAGLSDPKGTVRVFRFTISESTGQNYVLYQGVMESPATKEAVRRTVGR